MKIGFILADTYYNKRNLASSRIRGRWLIKYWKEAEEFISAKKYDVIIFQKTYWVEYAKNFKGIKILDICDPDWLEGHQIKEMIENVDAVVCSTYNLRDFIKQMTDKPVVVIPDRQDLEYLKEKKLHRGRAKSVVWYGYSHNAYVLKQSLPYLAKLGLSLIIISERFDTIVAGTDYVNKVKEKWIKWDLNKVNRDIIKADIVLLPQPFLRKDRFKSNNKTTNAWALGMPVAKTFDDLKRFLSEEERKKEAEKRLKEVKEKWDVRFSVEDYKNLIEKIRQNGQK